MEHIIHLLIGFIVLSFLLKTGFYPRWGIWLSALVYTVFLICIGPWATEQSPTEINSLLASAPHILTLSVYVTLEASIMIAFASTVLQIPQNSGHFSNGQLHTY